MKKYPVKKYRIDGEIHEGMYTYRGYTFWRNENVPAGFWGRYRLGRHSFTTQREVKTYIDSLLVNVLSEE